MKVSSKTKDDLSKFMKSSLDGLAATVSDATTFAKAQVPELSKEIIKFDGIVSNLVSLAYCILILIASGIATYYVVTVGIPADKEWIAALAGIGLVVFITSIGVGCIVTSILKAIYAPRLYLLEYTKNLLKEEKKS